MMGTMMTVENWELYSAGNLRGGKYSLYEAGTRVPFITYWKGKIKPQVSDEVVTQIDFKFIFITIGI